VIPITTAARAAAALTAEPIHNTVVRPDRIARPRYRIFGPIEIETMA
jgi:hypothetical protein